MNTKLIEKWRAFLAVKNIQLNAWQAKFANVFLTTIDDYIMPHVPNQAPVAGSGKTFLFALIAEFIIEQFEAYVIEYSSLTDEDLLDDDDDEGVEEDEDDPDLEGDEDDDA